MGKRSRIPIDIDGTRFFALPHLVVESANFKTLSYTARSLLLEFGLQLGSHNNGRLIATDKRLRARGWTSCATVNRAKQELLEKGFIFETVKGHRPNKASWFAVTWRPLDPPPAGKEYDAGAAQCFPRSAYRAGEPLKVKPTREDLFARHRSAGAKNATLTPGAEAQSPLRASNNGAQQLRRAPVAGAIGASFGKASAPKDGIHVAKPSPLPGASPTTCSSSLNSHDHVVH
jgi:hypothetical protein